MAFDKVEKIWMNGKMINWDDAKIHILAHCIHYSSAVFEGARCYKTKNGSAIFRLQEHTDRLFNSAKICRMEIPYTADEINDAIIELIKINKLEDCYIRPICYRGYDSLGVYPGDCPVELSIAVWKWGKYLGPEALENGVNVCVSSWNRPAPNTLPAMAKSAANYLGGQLIKMEAISHGYTEGIGLDVEGFVSEGSGENIFIVRNGVLITPPYCASILAGITRRTVIRLAEDLGVTVKEENIPREALYVADEVFFTGSAAEITPIATIDGIKIGEGKRGPITGQLQSRFFDVVENGNDPYGWLTFVYKEAGVTA